MTTLAASVFQRLSRSNARLLAARDLGAGFGLAAWENAQDRVRYEETRHHVLSLYTEDGTKSRRVDRQAAAGHPGALSLMPQGASSEWQIDGRFRFVHLYIPDAELRAFAAETLDRPPAAVALPEVTFADDPVLAGLLGQLARAEGVLASRGIQVELLHHLLTAPGWGQAASAPRRGGLAPATLRRLRARIEEELDQPLRLADLAATAGLSEFHFQRAFRASTGLSPRAWVERRRMVRAEALIAEGQPLAEVAAACGFAHHAHLTRAFRKAHGVAPSVWRAGL